VNIDGGWGGWTDYPFLAGAAFAWTTAAIVGSMYYALPPGCPPYSWGGYGYYHCGGAYYEPRYEGDTVVYVTVPDPSGGKAPAAGASAPAPSGASAPSPSGAAAPAAPSPPTA
jgi:hypothetical protein